MSPRPAIRGSSRAESAALLFALGLLFAPAVSIGQPEGLSAEEERVLRDHSEGGRVQTTLPDGNAAQTPGQARLSERDGNIPVDEDSLIEQPSCDNPPQGCNNSGCIPDMEMPRGCGETGCSPSSCEPSGCDVQPSSRDVSGALLPSILVGLALALIVFLALQFIRKRNRAAFDDEEEHALIREAREAVSLDPDATEDLSQAIHRVYLSTLLTLNERGLIIRAAWTPREIAQLAQLGECTPQMHELTHLAERVHFGQEGGTAAMLEEARSIAAQILSSYADARDDTSETQEAP